MLSRSRRGRSSRFRRTAALLLAGHLCLPAQAWNAHGHRIITLLALDGLPADAPDWLRDAGVRARIAYQANEPDRWRGTRMHPIGHENKPNHFLDLELLDQFGLTLESLPRFRYDYVQAMAVSKHVHPDKVDPYDATKDSDHYKQWPGFLPHAMAEHYAKLVASFNTLRILEELNEPRRAEQLAMARANAIYHMGMLSHFVGDAAQPLHTTRHFNGWDGENPNGYTTSSRFHSYIDGGVARRHRISYESMKPQVKYDRKVKGGDVWDDLTAHIQRSFDQMEPLYQLEKSGELDSEAGKTFIVERLADGASMLSSLYWAAYVEGKPTKKQLSDFARYNDIDSNDKLKGPQ
ncbi:MAG: hypothetical protein IID33_11380 [Planctomycetes bacterium]|nr:hypothetical protein [Planctomycetota bacterium]